MKFKIDTIVFDKFPNLVVAIPVITGFDNSKSEKEALSFLRNQEKELRDRFTLETFFKDPRVTSYQDTFKKFGTDPEKRMPAHVALSKRVLEGGDLPDINPMVNVYNAMSIKYTTPFGGEDLDSLYGDFVLRFADGIEKWTPIGGGKPKTIVKGDLVWGDDLDVSTPSLNWRQCERTKLVRESINGYFIMDGFSDVNRDVIEAAAKEFIDLALSYFGGKPQTLWLDKDHPEVEIDFKTKDVGSLKKAKELLASKQITVKEYVGIEKTIADALKKVTTIDNPQVGVTENASFGDYQSNIAMQKKVEGKSPRETAAPIVEGLTKDKDFMSIIDRIDVAGPGFINFVLNKDILIDNLGKISDGKENKNVTDLYKNKKISVEYTDPNPFKEFHIGHLYSNIIGESIARIFEANGAAVWRADFYGDVGMHVAKSVWGIMRKMDEERSTLEDLEKLSTKERQKFMGEGYAQGTIKYEEDEAVKEQIKDINYMVYVASQEVLEKERGWKPLVDYKKFIQGNIDLYEKVKPIYQKGLKWSLEYFETYYQRLGTRFDGYYPESWVGEYGVKFVEKGLEMGILEKSEGAVVFKGEKYGLHTRVFMNKFGLPTYEAKDLGLAKAKYEDFKYDRSLNIFGKEIDEYYYVVKKAMQLIEPELGKKAEHLAHGMVNLPEGKMSSRKGNVITVEWLLNEARDRSLKLIDNSEMNEAEKEKVAEMIGQAAVKYALLKNNIGNNITFDFNQSISFEGNSGPYVQYTYARTQSLLQKAGGRYQNSDNGDLKTAFRDLQSENLNKEELSLLRTFVHFPEVVAEAAEKYSPNLICNYLYDLAQKFNSFYNAHRILNIENENPKPDGDEKEEQFNSLAIQQFRLSLTIATGQILKKGLNLLGIQAPERM